MTDPVAAATRPPLHDVAHLGHIELLTPEPDKSLWFFVEVLGLTETGREGNSVYLRTWDDYERHTVKLTAHDTSGVRRVAMRASSQAALEARVAAVEAAGLGIGWKDGDPGIGPTYLFRDPDGHEMELYWESEWYTPPPALKPSLKNQAQAYPARGVCVRRLDHVNYLAADVPPSGDFVRDVLGGRVTEQIMLDDGTISAQWLHFTNKGYDLVYTRDWTGTRGRLHHVAFAPDTREDILRAADICLDRGVFIETGPHKHAIQQTFFLYVYEPGGNRIELCNPVARLVLAPDWRTVTWTEAERAKGQAWGLKTIESFHTHGTPPVGLQAGTAGITGCLHLAFMYAKTNQKAGRLTPRQKRIFAAVTVLVVVVFGGLIAWGMVQHDSYGASGHGCVNVTVPSSTGGWVLHYCGPRARTFCQSSFRSRDQISLRARPQCVLAGLGPASSPADPSAAAS